MNKEETEELVKRSQLFAYVHTMIEVEGDLRDNKTIMAFMDYAKKSMDQAINEIVETSPHDTVEISRCLVNIKTALYLKRTLERIISLGVQAEGRLREQDEDVARGGYTD